MIKNFLIVVGLLCLINTNITYACSCRELGSPTVELTEASAVFSGEVIDIQSSRIEFFPGAYDDLHQVKFLVSKFWKNANQAEMIVYTNKFSTACGYDFEVGEKYLVYASEYDGRLNTSWCTLTRPLDTAQIIIDEIGEGEAINSTGDISGNVPLSFEQKTLIAGLILCLGGIGALVFFVLRKFKTSNKLLSNMYNQLAEITNSFYQEKDYPGEVDFIIKLAQQHKINGNIVLDVTCGNGRHLREFHKRGYITFGNDLNPGMLKIAKQNLPSAKYWNQDMKKLDLPISVDMIICLFNSINYNFGQKELKSTLKKFYHHLNPGGVVVFDTMFTQDSWIDGHFSVQKLSQPKMDIVRISKSRQVKNRGVVDITYVVYQNKQKEILETVNEIYIFAKTDIIKALKSAGFVPEFQNDAFLTKKGLAKIFIGKKE